MHDLTKIISIVYNNIVIILLLIFIETTGQRVEEKDITIIFNLIHIYSDKWQDIGLGLGFIQPELNCIQLMPTLLHTAPKSYLKEMLAQWCQWPNDDHKQLPTIKALCKSLRSSSVGLGRLAGDVEKEFEVTKPTGEKINSAV